MKAKTEELLYLLLWGADQLFRPSYRNVTDSFESWAYRQGFHRQLQNLERRQFLERQSVADSEDQYRLTERGRVAALGGRDPLAAWNRRWDGQWRMVLFDLPEAKTALRTRLRRYLQDHAFGHLQNSVWITPHPLGQLLQPWTLSGPDVESLITFEARPGSGESNAAIVAGAWNFERINALYTKCLSVLEQLPDQSPISRNTAVPLRRWARMERVAWLEAVSSDPLLPRALLPADYLGERVWRQRQETLAQAAHIRDEVFR